MGGFEIQGLLGLVILLLDVWAILNIAESRASTLGRTLWIVLVLLVPVVGFLLWLVFGPRSRRAK